MKKIVTATTLIATLVATGCTDTVSHGTAVEPIAATTGGGDTRSLSRSTDSTPDVAVSSASAPAPDTSPDPSSDGGDEPTGYEPGSPDRADLKESLSRGEHPDPSNPAYGGWKSEQANRNDGKGFGGSGRHGAKGKSYDK